MIRTLALLLLLAPQGTDPAELVRQLGAADAAARDRASADLEKLGKAAIPALQNARASTDLEIRDRAIAVL
ncbi:MAG TPA: hypothetical protein VM222_05435, partial [Planctomycetota bacterium]|nr:hypothetical protein [Planctomycetota bacterium]